MRRAAARALLLAPLLASGAACPALAGQYVPPPVLPVPDAWQGRAQAVLRVLDKLDAHIETMTLKAGETGRYKSLAVTVRSCMDRPDGMPHDSAAFLDVQDQHGDAQPFVGWSFAGEPAIGVFESPVYGLQLVACQGELVAPAAPPLPTPPPPPPPSMVSNDSPGAGPDAGSGAGQGADPGAGQTDGQADGQPAMSAPTDQTQVDTPGAAPPDAVYPDGAPQPQPPP